MLRCGHILGRLSNMKKEMIAESNS